VSYHDLETNEREYVDVVPIWPIYSDETQKKSHEFEVTTPRDEQYRVEYESGTLDIDAMTDCAKRSVRAYSHKAGNFGTDTAQVRTDRVSIFMPTAGS